jgi:putative hydrolase
VADDDANPFANLPMFGDLAKALSGQGPLNWEAARQFAALAATGGEAERNPDPQVRIALAELTDIADMHIRAVTGLEPHPQRFEVVTVTPGAWAQRTLTDYQPLFSELAASLNQRPQPTEQEGFDPSLAMIAGLSQMMAPAMLGMAVGSMVGHLARRAFGQHDLPIPRPATSELVLVPDTVDAFAAEWELPRDDLRLWVLTQELAAGALFSVAHIREAVLSSVSQHVGGFRPDPNALMEKISSMEEASDDTDPMAALQRAFGDPEVLLGAVRSPQQEALQPRLDALLALVVGYVDHVVDAVSTRLLGSPGRIAEAVRRRRIEASPDDAFVERLLGLRLDRRQVERGKAFVAGVVERAGPEGLAQLYVGADNIPTPADLDAPGLWLARIDYRSA